MCLIVRKGTKEKVAEKDILVYKIVVGSSDESICYSYFRGGFLYEKDKKYSTHIEPKDFFENNIEQAYCDEQAEKAYEYDKEPLVAYSQGFHSCKYKERAFNLSYHNMVNLYVAEFIIPKGAKYISDRSDLVVSEAIIFKQILEWKN